MKIKYKFFFEMTTETNSPISVRIDPLKYLGKLPEFNGDYRDLHTFIKLVDRVHPILRAYDEPSQYLFSDIIKSRIKGKAREVIEINCQAESWTDIRHILVNNFGERGSIEELFDKLKSVTFKTNSIELYNDIKICLRRLNNKTLSLLGAGAGANECAKNNMGTALNVFKEKMPEPMKTILTCRNPDSLETAMDILFKSGYAHMTISNGIFSKNVKTDIPNISTTNKGQPRQPQTDNRQQKVTYQNNNSNHRYGNNPSNSSQRNISNNYNGNDNFNPNGQYQHQNSQFKNHSYQPQSRPYQSQQNFQKPNVNQGNPQQTSEPMDINMVQNDREYSDYEDYAENQESGQNYDSIEQTPCPCDIENSNQEAEQPVQNFLIRALEENYLI